MSIAANVFLSTKGLEQQAWEEARRRGIGGSDVGAICGVNPWKSAHEVYLDKIGELPPVQENEAMRFGKRMEEVIADEVVERTGWKVQRRNAILQHRDYPWALANVDRLIVDKSERGWGVLEIKTASEYTKDDWRDGRIPEQYILQLQWYLWITDLKWGAFATLVGGNKFFMHEVERDDELIAYMRGICSDFWRLVETHTPPEFDGTDASKELLNILYPEAEPETEIVLPLEAQVLIQQYETASQSEKVACSLKDEAANKLKSLLGDNEVGIVGDRKVMWKNVKSNRFDTTEFKDSCPELYDQYTKPSVSRRFMLK